MPRRYEGGYERSGAGEASLEGMVGGSLVRPRHWIGTVIRIVMEDRGAAIAAGEDVVEPAGNIEAWLAGHWGARAG